MEAKRYFNTSGPNNPAQHYTLMRPALVKFGMDMVRRDRYFTIWAPRQTGKSTYFRLLAVELEKTGYKVVHLNLESFKNSTLNSLLKYFNTEFINQDIHLADVSSFEELFQSLKNKKDGRLVWIIDEVESLNPDLFGQFLHTIRNLYHSRTEHCLKSVILVGISNIVGVVQDNASPFNIADNLEIPYFSNEETLELLGQHETEAGQLFEQKVKEQICFMTANQPGLVNGFALQLVTRHPDKPVISFEDYQSVEDWYTDEAIDKNVANILSKADKHRQFVETLLFTEAEIPFKIDRPAIKFLHTNGLIRRGEDGNVVFWVPLYKKRVFNAYYPYTNGEKDTIAKSLDIWNYLLPDGRLNLPKTIEAYKAYVQRRSFKYFREKFKNGKFKSIKEAALVYSFETFIQAYLMVAEGKSYLEPHVGNGRTDLLINVGGFESVVEAKVWKHTKQFTKGKPQLARYCRSLGLDEGYYLVFVPNHLDLVNLRIEEKPETINGVEIHTYIVLYDEEKDFQ